LRPNARSVSMCGGGAFCRVGDPDRGFRAATAIRFLDTEDTSTGTDASSQGSRQRRCHQIGLHSDPTRSPMRRRLRSSRFGQPLVAIGAVRRLLRPPASRFAADPLLYLPSLAPHWLGAPPTWGGTEALSDAVSSSARALGSVIAEEIFGTPLGSVSGSRRAAGRGGEADRQPVGDWTVDDLVPIVEKKSASSRRAGRPSGVMPIADLLRCRLGLRVEEAPSFERLTGKIPVKNLRRASSSAGLNKRLLRNTCVGTGAAVVCWCSWLR
jgi:hypothetical protein